MKAIVWTKYGSPDGLQLQEVAKPSPTANQVLIKIHASTVSTADCELRSFKAFNVFWLPLRLYIGLVRPTRITILGQELAGEIEAVGKDVTRFKTGDQVFAWTGFRLGANAEYTCLPETGMLAAKPANLTFAEAATLPIGGLEAVHFLRRIGLQNGQKVLINGAGGSIGTFAVQLAKYFGAYVTAVDSAGKLDMLRAIGADQAIDYAQNDFTRNGETYDVIFDVVGKAPFWSSVRSIRKNGQYLLGNPGLLQRFLAPWVAMTSGRKIIPYASRTAAEITEDINFLKELIEAGKIKPVIDRRYPLEQTAEAHRYVDTGSKKGNVVITLE
jgi:NADPH:quinone reductase-like Zn-dependent oxidoreductase